MIINIKKKDGKWDFAYDGGETSIVYYADGLPEGIAVSFYPDKKIKTKAFSLGGDWILYSGYDTFGRIVTNEFKSKGLLYRTEFFDYKTGTLRIFDRNNSKNYEIVPIELLNGERRYKYAKVIFVVKYKDGGVVDIKHIYKAPSIQSNR